MIPIVLVGAAGRMGRAVEQAAAGDAEYEIRARVDRAHPRGTGWAADLEEVLRAGDVAVEFTGPEGCARAAAVCATRGAALVSGTTGLDEAQERAVRAAAERIAVVRAANFSLGIAALRRALAAVLAGAPAGWDVEIVERHHRGKADSPSGTALALADDVTRAREGTTVRVGRGRGRTGPRPGGEVAVHAVRGGTWVGDHEVLIAGEGEWLELRHVAQDRLAFAQGALAAARFAARAKPGLYGMEDVTGAAAP